MTFPERLFIVTVGTTALGADQLGSFTTTDDSLELRECAAEFLKGSLKSCPRIYERVLRAHQDLWRTGAPVWPNRYATSAEMVSSYFLLRVHVTDIPTRSDKILFRVGHDRIILLSSDTAQGRFCACINAQLMHDMLFAEPCDCGVTYGPQNLQCAKGSVEITTLQGLEATEKGFETIPAQLKRIWERHTKPETQVLVNITGGYKGIIPALTYMCVPSKPPASLYYMHENMQRAASIYLREGVIEHREQDIPKFV